MTMNKEALKQKMEEFMKLYPGKADLLKAAENSVITASIYAYSLQNEPQQHITLLFYDFENGRKNYFEEETKFFESFKKWLDPNKD